MLRTFQTLLSLLLGHLICPSFRKRALFDLMRIRSVPSKTKYVSSEHRRRKGPLVMDKESLTSEKPLGCTQPDAHLPHFPPGSWTSPGPHFKAFVPPWPPDEDKLLRPTSHWSQPQEQCSVPTFCPGLSVQSVL